MDSHPEEHSQTPLRRHPPVIPAAGIFGCSPFFCFARRATIRPMPATATLLQSLDVITADAVTMLTALDEAESVMSPSDRREAKRRVLEIRGKAQELFDWLNAVGLEETRN